MSLESFICEMPKVELHVHIEGSIRPETLLKLAHHNQVPLPASDIRGLREWYLFTDFSHFIQVYLTIARCLCTPDDIELIAREFLSGQAAQNVLHTEATYTPYIQYCDNSISFQDQLAAINRARSWAAEQLGISMTLTIDIPRVIPAEEGMMIADWAISGIGNGVSAFGLGGDEAGNPPEKFKAAFDRTRAAGLPSVPHAGETVGPQCIWGALHALYADRIGHGVRCLEDPSLVTELRSRQVPLEVCPTSNICLKVFPSLAKHPLPELLAEGLYVTLNSDDPPMFNTTLTDEYILAAKTFGLGVNTVEKLALNGLRASFLPADARLDMEKHFLAEFTRLRAEHLENE